jgi:hypothetical protein
MSETPEHPGHFRGYYHWGADIDAHAANGYTTGLKLEPVEDDDAWT